MRKDYKIYQYLFYYLNLRTTKLTRVFWILFGVMPKSILKKEALLSFIFFLCSFGMSRKAPDFVCLSSVEKPKLDKEKQSFVFSYVLLA